MLSIWRRHNEGIPGQPESGCKHRAKGRKWTRCDCPVWSDGTLNHKRVRKSLETTSWQKGLEIIQGWQLAGRVEEERPSGVTVEDAIAQFLAELGAQARRSQTIANQRSFLGSLRDFTKEAGIVVVGQFTLDLTRKFRLSWKCKVGTSRQRLTNLRSFFKFCCVNKWMKENHASVLKPPRAEEPDAQPFSLEQIQQLLGGLDRWIANKGYECISLDDLLRVRALVLLMRYTGLRIGDAVNLHADNIVNSEIWIARTQKTGASVCFPLPAFVITALDQSPRVRPNHWFLSGQMSPLGEVNRYRNLLYKVWKGVGVSDANPHRFRHTFAVSLLESGMPLDHVSRLLGHRSVKTTERHYAKWTRTRRDQTAEGLKRAIQSDPIALAEQNRSQGAKLRRVK